MDDAGSAARRVELTFDTPEDWPALRQRVEGVLRDLDRRLCVRASDWVGHCKALVATADGSAYASLTGAGEAISWRGELREPASRAELTIYAAVWGLTEEVVTEALASVVYST